MPTSPTVTVLAGPTAVGKGTVSTYVRDHYPDVWLSVSATTRAPRPGEVDGVHYFFVRDDEFDRMIDEDDLLEAADANGALCQFGREAGLADSPLAGEDHDDRGEPAGGRPPGSALDGRRCPGCRG